MEVSVRDHMVCLAGSVNSSKSGWRRERAFPKRRKKT